MFKQVVVSTIIAVSSLLLLAGCSNPTKPTPTPAPTGEGIAPGEPSPGSATAQPASKFPFIRVTDAEALNYCPDVEAVHLQDSGISLMTTEIKHAYLCQDDSLVEPAEDGKPKTVTVFEVTDGLFSLLEAYSAENASVTPATTCILSLPSPLIVWVSGGNNGITPIYAPVDECGFPQQEAAEAYRTLKTEPLLTVPVS